MSWKHGLWCQTVWVQSLSPTFEWSSLGLIFSSGNRGQHWNLLHRIVSRMKWDISYKGMHSVNGSYYYYLFLCAYSTGLKYFSKCFYPGEIFSFIICIHPPICKSITVSLSLSYNNAGFQRPTLWAWCHRNEKRWKRKDVDMVWNQLWEDMVIHGLLSESIPGRRGSFSLQQISWFPF